MASLIDRFRQLSTKQKALVGVGALVAVAGIVVGGVAVIVGGTTTTTTTTIPTTTTTLPPAPLTGIPAVDRSVLERPAISVKLGNNPEARPQEGLNASDIVYEEEVEGRITRFLVVVHSQTPGRVGPIRSVRLMDGPIARPFGGLFVYSGGANVPQRIANLDEAGLVHLNETQLAGLDSRVIDPDHGNGVRPNILFTIPERLWAQFGDVAPPQPAFGYLRPGQSFDGGPARVVRVPVGPAQFNPTWRWDDDEGMWFRYLGDEPFLDKSGDQVGFENLVVQFVTRAGEESIVMGSGEAYVLSDGKMVPARWEREDPDAPTRFFDAAGNEIRLTPGRTWVHLPLAGAGDVMVLDD